MTKEKHRRFCQQIQIHTYKTIPNLVKEYKRISNFSRIRMFQVRCVGVMKKSTIRNIPQMYFVVVAADLPMCTNTHTHTYEN